MNEVYSDWVGIKIKFAVHKYIKVTELACDPPEEGAAEGGDLAKCSLLPWKLPEGGPQGKGKH